MYTLSINMWFQKLIRQFFMSLDQVVFNFISTVYDLLISISRTSILSQSDFLEFSDRIYKLLAVFMIFKVILSLITYVVNPDDFSDKTKGISKLGTNIVISLGLLVITPYIFNYAYTLQNIILEENTLMDLIFGEKNHSNNIYNSAGDELAFATLLPFFTPDTSIEKLYNCVVLLEVEVEDGQNIARIPKECSGVVKEGNSYVAKGNLFSNSLAAIVKEDYAINYAVGVEKKNIGLMFKQNIGVATYDDSFVMEYKYIFSTVVGVVVILILLSFCLDIALRSIKLAFLQIIAPIPILSYVDPKSGKDGMFKKWYQLCFKTYISLFVRLLAIYFAIYLISKVNNMVDILDGTIQTNLYVRIFIIIGALMFAKDLPKILEGLGIKLDGGGKFTLNPFKKLENEALGGKFLRNTARGAAVGGLAGAAAFGTNLATTGHRFRNAKGFWGKTGAVFSSVGGGVSAAARGVKSGLKGEKFGKGFTSSYSGAMKAKHDRAMRNQMEIGFFERTGYKLSAGMGNLTYSDTVKNSVKDIEDGKGSKEGFTTALQRKYGIEQGKKISDSLESSTYMRQSNKELETAKKVQKAKQDHVNAVMSGKDKIEAIVSKDRGNVKAKERNVKAVEARTDADYKSGLYGDIYSRFLDSKGQIKDEYKDLMDRYTNPSTSESERESLYDQMIGAARNVDRSKAKKELDTEIAKTLVEDLGDPNRKAEATKVFKDLYTSVLSTEDEELRKEFEKQFGIDKDNPDVNFEKLFDGMSEQEKTNKMMSIIDSFGTDRTKGTITAKASSVRAKAVDEVETIDLILDARSVQTSDIQNSEEARHQADIASTVGKK